MSNATAERCLVAVCAHLSLTVVRNEDFAMWLSAIREVLPDCQGGAEALAPLRYAADQVVSAKTPETQSTAMALMRWEAQRYFTLVAAHRFEAWKVERGLDDVRG